MGVVMVVVVVGGSGRVFLPRFDGSGLFLGSHLVSLFPFSAALARAKRPDKERKRTHDVGTLFLGVRRGRGTLHWAWLAGKTAAPGY